MNARGLAQAITLAGGFAKGRNDAAKEESARQQREDDRAMRRQEFDARMGEVNQQKNLRMSLADAATPATVTEDLSHVVAPDEMGPSLTQYKVKGAGLDQTYDNKSQADKAVQDYSAPDAVASRQAGAYRAAGAPEKALTLENAAFTQKREKLQLDNEQVKHAKMLREEGVFSAARALRAGDANEFASSFNSGGKARIIGVPVVTTEERDAPGETGKIPTFTARFKLQKEDGTVTDETRNSHDLSMQLLPFEKALEFQGKSSKDAEDSKYKAGMLGAAQKTAEAAMIRANGLGGGGSKAPSGYRTSADGNLEVIPGGPADKKASTGKPLNDSQSKALLFGSRMRDSDAILSELESNGTTISVPFSDTKVGNTIASPAQQRLNQAKRNFINATLRRESGAVISPGEFASAETQYFPSVGDSKEVIAQKAANRKLSTQGILYEVPEQHRNAFAPQDSTGKSGATGSWSPDNTAKAKSFNVGGAATEARQAPDGKYYVKQANGKYAEVRN
jgi:hypothetical protein